MTREEKIAKARDLRALGWTAPDIGAELGVSESTVRNWYLGGNCEKCGTPVDGSDAQKARLCRGCHAARNAERNARLRELWEAGEPSQRIAEKLDMPQGEVCTWIDQARRLRGENLSRRQLPHDEYQARWERIGELVKAGRSNSEIAEEIGSTRGAVGYMIQKARRRGYDIPYRRDLAAA